MSTGTPAPPAPIQAGGQRPRRHPRWSQITLIAVGAVVVLVGLGALAIFVWQRQQQTCVKAADPARSGAVTEYCPSEPYRPSGAMTAGPDGNLWYTDSQQKIARFTLPSGISTEFAAPSPPNQVAGLVRGTDDHLWYIANDQLGRISMNGAFNEFTLPKEMGLARRIAAGSDGTLWVTMSAGDPYQNIHLLQMPIPSAPTEEPLLTEVALPVNTLGGVMATARDGTLWMATASDTLTHITPAGAITQFALHIPGPAPSCGVDCKTVLGLTAGPGGSMWFIDGWGHAGRITSSGATTFFRVGGELGQEIPLSAGPDGTAWFSLDGSSIERITPAGVVTRFALPHTDSQISSLTIGPDGGIWFVQGWSQPGQPSSRFVRLTP